MNDMNAHQQRIAIAEFCGWRPAPGTVWGECQIYGIPPKGEDHHWCRTPDYPNDLAAMHEAEKMLTPEQAVEYMEWLGMCDDDYGFKVWAYVHSDAAKRAEAFLRALNLYIYS